MLVFFKRHLVTHSPFFLTLLLLTAVFVPEDDDFTEAVYYPAAAALPFVIIFCLRRTPETTPLAEAGAA